MVERIVRIEEIEGRHGLVVKTSLSESYLRIERKRNVSIRVHVWLGEEGFGFSFEEVFVYVE